MSKYPICPECGKDTIVLFTPPKEPIRFDLLGTDEYVDWDRAHIYCCNGETDCKINTPLNELTTPQIKGTSASREAWDLTKAGVCESSIAGIPKETQEINLLRELEKYYRHMIKTSIGPGELAICNAVIERLDALRSSGGGK